MSLKLKASSMLEVVSAILILSVVFAIVMMISSNVLGSSKSLTAFKIESEIDLLIEKENTSLKFIDDVYELDGYKITTQFDRDINNKIVVIGSFEAYSNANEFITKQEFLFLDK